MASNWISDPQWDSQGKPYVTMLMDGPGYKKGDRRYIAPAEVHPSNSYGQDPKLLAWAQGNQAPGQSLLHERGQWNPRTGKWDQGINYTNLASIGVGGLIAAPFVVPALAGLGGGGAGAGTGAATTGAATTGAATTGAATTAGVTAGTAGTAGTVGGFSIVPPAVAYGGSAAIPTAAGGGGMVGWLGKLGLTVKDLFSGGAEIYDMISDNRANAEAAKTNDRYMQMALDFAKSQYADTTKREQERWDATEARRVPYRAASQDVLREFRNLLGLD